METSCHNFCITYGSSDYLSNEIFSFYFCNLWLVLINRSLHAPASVSVCSPRNISTLQLYNSSLNCCRELPQSYFATISLPAYQLRYVWSLLDLMWNVISNAITEWYTQTRVFLSFLLLVQFSCSHLYNMIILRVVYNEFINIHVYTDNLCNFFPKNGSFLIHSLLL